MTASVSFEAVDDANETIPHYVFNDNVKGLKAGERFALSDNIDFSYELEQEYELGESVNVKFSLRYNTIGVWSTPEDNLMYFKQGEETKELTTEDVVTNDVTVEYSAQDKFEIFVKEKPYVVALAVIGILAVVGLICYLSILVYRKKRITKSAWREILYSDMWNDLNGKDTTDESKGAVDEKAENESSEDTKK